MRLSILFLMASVLTTLALVLTCPASSFAQTDTSETPGGGFRLSLDTPFLGFHLDRIQEGNDEIKTFSFQGGIGGGRSVEALAEELPFAPRVELGMAGKVGGNLILGARIQATVMPRTIKDKYTDPEYPEDSYEDKYSLTTVGLGALPFLEVLLSSGRVVPFVTVMGGFRMDIAKFTADESDYTYKLLLPRGVVGAGAGAHFFLGSRCSVDLSFTGVFEIGKIVAKDEGDDYYYDDNEDKADYMHVGMEAALGISAWI